MSDMPRVLIEDITHEVTYTRYGGGSTLCGQSFNWDVGGPEFLVSTPRGKKLDSSHAVDCFHCIAQEPVEV